MNVKRRAVSGHRCTALKCCTVLKGAKSVLKCLRYRIWGSNLKHNQIFSRHIRFLNIRWSNKPFLTFHCHGTLWQPFPNAFCTICWSSAGDKGFHVFYLDIRYCLQQSLLPFLMNINEGACIWFSKHSTRYWIIIAFWAALDEEGKYYSQILSRGILHSIHATSIKYRLEGTKTFRIAH